MIAIDLIYNLALLVALSVISGFIGQRWKHGRIGLLMQGVVFGSVAVIGMLRPLVLAPGLIFDGRSVMISLCGLFFGPLAVSVAGGMAVVCRLFQGGVGAPMGVFVILSSALLGWFFHVRWMKPGRQVSVYQPLGFGFFVHVAMVLLMFTLPGSMVFTTMKRIGPPVLLLYPLATLLVGKILSDHKAKDQFLEDLRESENHLCTLLKTIPDLVWLKDVQGVYLSCNPRFESFFGAKVSDIVGKTDYDFVDRELADFFRRHDKIAMAEGKPCVNEEEITFAEDGHRELLETIKTPMLGEEGQLIGVLGIARDITARKRTEEEKRQLEERLQRAEKMEALGTLAGGVAHDLNNVLGVVVGYAELLLDDVDAANPIRQHIVNIMHGGQKAAAIIQDLLTLARRGVPGRSVLNLNKIIDGNLNSPELRKLLSFHPEVRIRTALAPDLLNISGSAVHLGKTLFNLVSNAMEAMPMGGVVTITTGNQYLDKPIRGYDEIREGDYVVFSVSDTGEGIAESDLKRIFEPFYTKKVMGRSGTGLGLAVVWGTVKDHNGYINVESEAWRGSTFTLYFPVTREDLSAETASLPVSQYLGKGESILVVDDVKEQRALATTMLRKLNYAVESVSSGEEALAYIRSHSVDLMVLDMIMASGMDGLDTYRRILQIRPKQKAIIVSGFSESERVSAAQSIGAGAYVRKPYVIEKLGFAVKREIERTQ